MMTIFLYIAGYFFIGAAMVGVLAGLDEKFFSGSSGDDMAMGFTVGWPIVIIGSAIFAVYFAAKQGVLLVKKFMRL